MKYTAAEIIDFIENKVQIDVKLLSAEEINKTIEIFGCAIEIIEKAELLQAELKKAHDEAVKDFSHFLIDKAVGGSVAVDELPDLIVEWGSPSRKGAEVMKEANTAFDKAGESLEAYCTLNEGSITGKSWYDARFNKVE